jgi:septum formation protein
LLTAAGFTFTQMAADVDERPEAGEAAAAYVLRVARAKAHALAAAHPDAIVLGADTVVVVDGALLGKPRDRAEAASMLGRLQGRAHEVLTGVAVVRGETSAAALASTTVEFGPMDPVEIAAYVATGEPMDKAGAYAVQGIASRYVTRIDGSYSNVVGLPIFVVHRLLGEFAGGRPQNSPAAPPPACDR